MIEWPFRVWFSSLKKFKMFAQPIGCSLKGGLREHVLSTNIKMDGVEVIIVID